LAEELKAACPGRLDASVWGRDAAEIQVAPAAPPVASVYQDASVRLVSSVALQDAWVVRQGALAFALREPRQDARLAPRRMLPVACPLALQVLCPDQKAQEDAWVAAKPLIPEPRALQFQASVRLAAREDALQRAQQMAGQLWERGARAPDQAQQERASAAQLPRVVQQ
jgi:hypothetical protein